MEAPPDSETGIVRLTLHQAKDLGGSRTHHLNAFARVYTGGSTKEIFSTAVMKQSDEPIWESSTEFLVPERKHSVITIAVLDTQFGADPTLGTMTVQLTDLLAARDRQQDWWPLQRSKSGGKIRLTAEWKPVAMTGSLSGAGVYVPPIGMLRVWIKKAVDVKNVEGAMGGKSDPYVRIMGNNKVLGRTEVINNNLNPEWDQIVYVPVHNPRENLIVEMMDYQNLGKDRTLGITELKVADCAQPSNDPMYPYESKGKQERADRIRFKNLEWKGTLYYEVDFKPAVSLKGGVSFDAKKNELEEAAEEVAANDMASPPTSPTSAKNPVSPSKLPLPASPLAVTASQVPASTHRPSQSIASVASMKTANSTTAESKAGGVATAAERPDEGVEMTNGELMRQRRWTPSKPHFRNPLPDLLGNRLTSFLLHWAFVPYLLPFLGWSMMPSPTLADTSVTPCTSIHRQRLSNLKATPSPPQMLPNLRRVSQLSMVFHLCTQNPFGKPLGHTHYIVAGAQCRRSPISSRLGSLSLPRRPILPRPRFLTLPLNCCRRIRRSTRILPQG